MVYVCIAKKYTITDCLKLKREQKELQMPEMTGDLFQWMVKLRLLPLLSCLRLSPTQNSCSKIMLSSL